MAKNTANVDIGLIPVAGEGVRAYPSSLKIPKTLFDIGGKSLLQRNLEIMRDKIGIKKVYIIIGHLGEIIRRKFGNGESMGMEIQYIECKNIKAGLAKGIYLARDYIKSNFVVILGDEFYLNSNHEELRIFPDKDYDAICGVKITGNHELIRKNYSVRIKNNRVVSLKEKPSIIENPFLGCGTYVFTPRIFEYIEKTKPSHLTKRVELTDVIDNMARNKSKVYPLLLKGEYSNINTFGDLNASTYIFRGAMLKDHKTSLIIPAYNEKDSIGYVIDEFKGMVDEILVVDNCSTDKTALIAKKKGVKVITKKLKGYGDALKYGMDNASGDIFILMEADASFKAQDLPKILEYLKDADMVIGTRTTKEMIEQGANMDALLRWGNLFAAKFIELLWINQEPRFTDVGCTYRGIWKDTYLSIRDRLTGTGPEFSPEMMVEILRAKKKVIEIPVTYRPRIGGVSKLSGNRVKTIKTALRMMKLVLKKRFNL